VRVGEYDLSIDRLDWLELPERERIQVQGGVGGNWNFVRLCEYNNWNFLRGRAYKCVRPPGRARVGARGRGRGRGRATRHDTTRHDTITRLARHTLDSCYGKNRNQGTGTSRGASLAGK
jgi:hypothetical protein